MRRFYSMKQRKNRTSSKKAIKVNNIFIYMIYYKFTLIHFLHLITNSKYSPILNNEGLADIKRWFECLKWRFISKWLFISLHIRIIQLFLIIPINKINYRLFINYTVSKLLVLDIFCNLSILYYIIWYILQWALYVESPMLSPPQVCVFMKRITSSLQLQPYQHICVKIAKPGIFFSSSMLEYAEL